MGKSKPATQKPKAAPAPKLDAYGHPPGHKLYGLEPQFGAWWHPTNHPPLRRHLIMFRGGLEKYPQSLGRAEHFKAATQILWGPRNARKKFLWHPWAERMLEAACAEMDKSPKNFLAVAGCASSGKCLAPETPVLKFDGSVVPAKDIRPGDLLMGDDSTPRKVLVTNPGRSNMVRIVPYSGDSWECNDDHILVLKRTWSGASSKRRVGETVEISVKDYLATSAGFKRRHRLYLIGVEFPETPVEVDPRVYGIWLGDGATSRPIFHLPDTGTKEPLYRYVINTLERAGLAVTSRVYDGSRIPTLIAGMGAGKPSVFTDLVRESSGVVGGQPTREGEKRILRRYLINSRRVRSELLAGILDTDGYTQGTYVEFSCALKGLSEDVAYLARSLGFRVSVTPRFTSCQGKKFLSYRLNISGDFSGIPFMRLRVVDKKLRKASEAVGFKVEQLGEGDWYGWTLDGNGRFLLGDFTVTHNTDWAAVWAIINFLCLPEKTMVIVTSTTLKDSRKRIWGSIRDYWQAIPGRAPGKLVDSQGLIRYDLGGNEASDKSGITLVAAEKSKDKEALGKLIGFKADRLILIADELPELGESVVGAAYSNLANNPSFQMIGLGNPSSYYDAFGVFAKPKAGWASINAGSEEWETERGVCIRFDGEKSPNILAGKTIYPWMITQSFLDQQRESLGENSGAYWRMVRGFWSSTGASDGIYSEADIVKFKADQPTVWLTPPIKIAALDPAFTNGGDRSALYFGYYGDSKDGLKTLCFDHVEFLAEDVTDKDNPRTFQIVKQFRDRCEAFGVLPENAAFDFSGAGKPFGDIVSREWSPKVNRIDFAGKASDLPASVSDPTPSCERYANRVTEIWFGAKELIRTQQIRGVSTSLAKEMCARTYSTVKGASMRLLAEPKPEMKMRIGKSPDEADAALMLVALCRERFGFGADVATERGVPRSSVRPLREQLRRLNIVNVPRMITRV
jgi:hypothetical protein